MHIYLQRHCYLNDVQTLKSSLILIISALPRPVMQPLYISVSETCTITNLVELLVCLRKDSQSKSESLSLLV